MSQLVGGVFDQFLCCSVLEYECRPAQSAMDASIAHHIHSDHQIGCTSYLTRFVAIGNHSLYLLLLVSV